MCKINITSLRINFADDPLHEWGIQTQGRSESSPLHCRSRCSPAGGRPNPAHTQYVHTHPYPVHTLTQPMPSKKQGSLAAVTIQWLQPSSNPGARILDVLTSGSLIAVLQCRDAEMQSCIAYLRAALHTTDTSSVRGAASEK